MCTEGVKDTGICMCTVGGVGVQGLVRGGSVAGG
jgi:hypothetical protein